MSKSIQVTVNVPVKALKDMIKTANLEIKDKASFKALIETEAFKTKLAADMLMCFEIVNAEEDNDDSIINLFGSGIVDYNFD